MIFSDTIAAIATPPGFGGISIVRLSGENSINIVNHIFSKDIMNADGYTMHYGKITDDNGGVLDEVLVSVFRAPKSYTGENSVEINCHGGMTSANAILIHCIKNGARIALGGEFTKRAFLNGKIDLAQAEAVADIINSNSEKALSLGVNQLGGALSEQINTAREHLIKIMAQLSSEADFPDEGVSGFSDESLKNEIGISLGILEKLLNTANEGRLVKDGISVALLGKPNAGKSSLLNALLNKTRAIVTAIPGTTRDTVEDYMQIDGIALKIIDTAGIREASDEVEKIGIDLSKKAAQEADISVYVADLSTSPDEDDVQIANLLEDKKVILVLNKTDIAQTGFDDKFKNIFKNAPACYICAQNNEGIENVKNTIKTIINTHSINATSTAMLTNMRHIEAVTNAYNLVKNSVDAYNSGIPADFISIDLQAAIEHLGSVTGMNVSEEIVDRVFKDFCVGK